LGQQAVDKCAVVGGCLREQPAGQVDCQAGSLVKELGRSLLALTHQLHARSVQLRLGFQAGAGEQLFAFGRGVATRCVEHTGLFGLQGLLLARQGAGRLLRLCSLVAGVGQFFGDEGLGASRPTAAGCSSAAGPAPAG
jgi:hypothetical protein